MQKTIVTMPSKILAGITTQTSNELEFNPNTGKIPMTMHEYFTNKQPRLLALLDKNENDDKEQQKENNDGFSSSAHLRLVSHNIYAVYTEYESDYNGMYTYFIGQEISSIEDMGLIRAQDMHVIKTKEQKYAKFTSNAGKMPDVCIELWQHIWSLSPEELGGVRSYKTDFELYDSRANDLNNAIMEIYIGIE